MEDGLEGGEGEEVEGLEEAVERAGLEVEAGDDGGEARACAAGGPEEVRVGGGRAAQLLRVGGDDVDGYDGFAGPAPGGVAVLVFGFWIFANGRRQTSSATVLACVNIAREGELSNNNKKKKGVASTSSIGVAH